MSTYAVDPQRCTGCGVCVRSCPVDAIVLSGGRARIVEEKCIDCGVCARKCPFGAIVESVAVGVTEPAGQPVTGPEWDGAVPTDQVLRDPVAGGFARAGGRRRQRPGGGLGCGWGCGRGGGGMRGRRFGGARGRNGRFGGGWR